jgi:hypothetical protein
MSGQDSPPQNPRRKKLVLRKIAVDGASVPDTWSNSYTGPLPVVRPPPRPSFTNEAVIEAEPDAEPEIISEMAIDATVIVAPSPDAWAAAAMTAAVPRASDAVKMRSAFPVEATRTPSPVAAAVAALAPLAPPETSSRTTVSPVVATLAPVDSPAPLPSFGRSRFSLDSKVLAAGGAMAAAMLLVALGVFLGVRSTRSTAATTASSAPATLGTFPVVVDAKASGSMPSAPPVAVDVPSVAAPVAEKADPIGPVAKSDRAGARDHTSGASKGDAPLTIDVSQLPAAQPARTKWTPVAPPKAEATGWTVAGVAPVPAAPPNSARGGAAEWAPSDAPPAASGAAPAAEIPATPQAPVDPLVQAVREDIREDEAARAK